LGCSAPEPPGSRSSPKRAKEAGELTVFQRTAAYTAPARNVAWDPDESEEFRASYAAYRESMRDDAVGAWMYTTGKPGKDISDEELTAALDAFYEVGGQGYASTFTDTLTDESVNQRVAEYIRRRMAERIEDPKLKAKLIPTDYPMGARNAQFSDAYFRASLSCHQVSGMFS
jgi:cation diffusion facilitator CzcD-associated flavoprotein CzcO